MSVPKESAPGFFTRLREGLARAKAVFRKEGVRGMVRHYGWKLVAAFFVYYLVRDVTLYVVLPYFLLRGCVEA